MSRSWDSPSDKIRRIEEIFLKVPPGFEAKPRRNYTFVIFLVILLTSGALIEYKVRFFGPRLKGAIEGIGLLKKGDEKTDEKVRTSEEKSEIADAKEKEIKKICKLKLPLAQDAINTAIQMGIKSASIEIEDRKKVNRIRLFVGDFASLKDAVVVSDRLNEKGVAHRIENAGDKWRVYIEKEIGQLSKILSKENITPDDIRYIEKTASDTFREIIRAEVEKTETTVINLVLQFDSERECDIFFKALQPKFPVRKE